MQTGPNYYTIGIFVTIGLTLVIATLIILGASALWRVQVTVETYVDESIQGIDIGSQVKMRGVQIGNVSHVSFVHIKYPEAAKSEKRYVLLEITLSLKAFGDTTPEQFETFLAREVLHGLRIRMLPMGITGSAYIEMDYLDPAKHPPLPINWEPEHPYVPSAPGTFARLEETFESLSNTMSRIGQMDFQKTLNNFNELITNLNTSVQSAQVGELTTQARLFLEEIRQSNQQISRLLGPLEVDAGDEVSIYAMMSDTGLLIQDIRQALDSIMHHGDGDTMKMLSETIANFRETSEQMPLTLQKIRDAAFSMQQSTAGFNRLTRRTYSLMNTQNEKIESIFRDMEITIQNLMELTTDAKRYPSYILFGDKPKEIEPK